ncbi:MAG: molybdopterin-dependent oxidoreductase [Actinobacteria bacterium]|nr:molybdopterin-dependent oxidoreductase [Actinomycetota bacterium]
MGDLIGGPGPDINDIVVFLTFGQNTILVAVLNLHDLFLGLGQDIFLTETAQLADVVLPAACFAEKDATFTNSERRIQRVRKAVEPPAGVPEDWRTLMEVGRRLGIDWSYDNAEQIFEEIAFLTPSYGGVSYARLEQEGGLQWPCPSADHPGTQFLHNGMFPRGKGLFHAIEHQEPLELPDAEFPLTLTTGRVLYQYHTRTMTGRAKGVNDLAPVFGDVGETEGFAKIDEVEDVLLETRSSEADG